MTEHTPTLWRQTPRQTPRLRPFISPKGDAAAAPPSSARPSHSGALPLLGEAQLAPHLHNGHHPDVAGAGAPALPNGLGASRGARLVCARARPLLILLSGTSLPPCSRLTGGRGVDLLRGNSARHKQDLTTHSKPLQGDNTPGGVALLTPDFQAILSL